MNFYCFQIKNTMLDVVWSELEALGIIVHCSIEDPEQNKCELYGEVPTHISEIAFASLKNILSIKKLSESQIDWPEQWASHSQFYSDGFVHLDLSAWCPALATNPKWSTIRLEPGPGFGDLSHSTTRLVLQLMQAKMHQKVVVDIGCGSGVLSLAAVAMGASAVYGIDIDAQALSHAQRNSVHNAMETYTSFKLPEEFSAILERMIPNNLRMVVLMNMIHSEQRIAWESVTQIYPYVTDCLISGILEEERAPYLEWCKKWDWQLKEEIQEEGWLAFHFSMGQ